MQATNDILNFKVSFQENTWTNINVETTIESILDEIKSDKYAKNITDLRQELEKGNKEYYDNYKKRLPAVTFSATFKVSRTKENINYYNSIIVLDIDKLNLREVEVCYNHLLNDQYVISFWRSPSNNGFKGLVQLDYIDIPNEIDIETKHKSAFSKLSKYFYETYKIELDQSGSDISRLCFLSYDKNLIIKESYIKFQITNAEINIKSSKAGKQTQELNFIGSRDVLYNPLNRNNQFNRKLTSDIIRYLTNKNLSITNSYSEWCKVAMAIANTFTFEIGLNYFTKLSKLDSGKYDEKHCINFLKNCYETKNGSVSFASIIYLANEKGFKTKKQKLKYGVPKVED
jgi:hypothetical protein